MPLTLAPAAPPIRLEASGAARVGSSNVLLEIVIRAFLSGATPETIVERFSTLRLADVYAVVGYYLEHTADVERYLAEREALAESVRARVEAPPEALEAIRHRLSLRRDEMGHGIKG